MLRFNLTTKQWYFGTPVEGTASEWSWEPCSKDFVLFAIENQWALEYVR